MNRTTRRLGAFVAVMLLALIGNLTYIQVVKAVDYRHNPHNKRTVLEEYSRARGQITAAGGVVLAQSNPSHDQYRYQRIYPNGKEYANLTGYYSLRYGPSNLERLQNDLLAGNDPSLFVEQLSDLITGRDPHGGNVELTIVPAIQKAAYDGLASKNYVGAVVAIKPSTGAVLAMASTPSYDPNPLASHSSDTQRKAYNKLVAESPSPMLDRAIDAVYPPGSTFKLVVTAAALQHGYTPKSMLPGAPTITLPGTDGVTLSNYDHENCASNGGLPVTMTQALAHSCNTAYATLAMNLGADALRDQANALGIDGESSHVDGFPVVGSRLGTMANTAALAQSGIGQRDVALTPFADAVIAATIANHGTRMKPYLIDTTTRPDLSVISHTKPEQENKPIPSAVADQIRDMMIQSEHFTGGSGKLTKVTVASKTGTAEHGTEPKKTPPHAWYVAFAPADHPVVAVAVLVTNGGDRGLDATGATVAAPIGRAVIKAALAGTS